MTISRSDTQKPKLTPQEAEARVRTEGAFLLDVRGFDEFAAGHADGAACIPLPDLERRAGEIPTDCMVCVMCQSGGRSAMAVERLRSLGFDNIADVAGGFGAWRAAGLPAIVRKGVIPLERQVRGIAGFLVLTFSLLGLFVSRWFFAGPLFVGFMLFLSGVTGLCPMLSLLRLMPWNRAPTQSARLGRVDDQHDLPARAGATKGHENGQELP
jgi:rhodanese-related sulfurtransferase